ncbi:MAG: L-rhamnose mutarotase [Bacteroidota bacterium]
MRHCLALDLKDDPALIAEYRTYHERIWPEIAASIRDSGIDHMEIWLAGNRLFMIIEAGEGFSFSRKAAADASNPTVQEWERLMWNYQQAIPAARPGEKWVLMEKIFDLGDQ